MEGRMSLERGDDVAIGGSFLSMRKRASIRWWAIPI